MFWGQHHREYGRVHEYFFRKPKELRDKYDWFMVCRNPYDYMISNYYQYCKWKGLTATNDPKHLNEIIQAQIQQPNAFGGFFSHQHKFLDATSKIDVLRFESLEEDFDDLMKRYGIDAKLEHHNKTENKQLSRTDLFPETIRFIQTIFHDDFQTFGYLKEF